MDCLVSAGEVSKAMAVIESIDLANVMRKLRLSEGWSEEEAATAERRYRRFLCLHYLDAEFNLVPTLDIDKVWHQHILHTQDYALDCERVFGAFLHHAPGADDSEDTQQHMRDDFEKTGAFYRERFGEEYVESWLTYFLL